MKHLSSFCLSTDIFTTTASSATHWSFDTFDLVGFFRLIFSLAISSVLPQFRLQARLKFMPPIHRIPYSHLHGFYAVIFSLRGAVPWISVSGKVILDASSAVYFRSSLSDSPKFFLRILFPSAQHHRGCPTAPKGGLEIVPVKPSLAVHRVPPTLPSRIQLRLFLLDRYSYAYAYLYSVPRVSLWAHVE